MGTPWVVDTQRDQVLDSNGDWVVDTYERHLHLIAAAPELLEALKALVDYWDSGNFSRKPELAQQMKNAIAKAEGR